VSDTWSPDESPDNEAYESWDEALDQQDELEPDRLGGPEGERSLDRQLVVDQGEVEEAGVGLDDPERMATIDGGGDDPDGDEPPPSTGSVDDEGWDLDAGDEA
jgi:hypothetical protein